MVRISITENSNQEKYGSLNKGLLYQFSMNNNKYPINPTDTTDTTKNNQHGNYISQGRKSHNPSKWKQNTEQKSTENRDDKI